MKKIKYVLCWIIETAKMCHAGRPPGEGMRDAEQYNMSHDDLNVHRKPFEYSV